MSLASKHPWLAALVIFVFFFAVYLATGLQLFGEVAWRNDELFEIDAARVADWMTNADALHLRTRVHPLYVLGVQPLGAALEATTGSTLLAVQTLTAAFTAGAVAASFLVGLRLKQDPALALGIALLFGLSAAQGLLGAVPDTTGLATLALVGATALFASDWERGAISQLGWLAVGVLALGVTMTNLVAPVLLFAALCFGLHPNAESPVRHTLRRVAIGLACVVSVVVVLSLVQQALYGNTKLFFLPDLAVHEVGRFASLTVLEAPAAVIPEVLKHFFLAAVVAPLPHEIFIHDRPAVSFVGSLAFTPAGWAAASLWLGLAAVSLWKIGEASSRDRLLSLACLAAVGVQLLMHCFYGVAERGKMEFFLYTGNAAWMVIVLVTSGLRAGSFASRAALVLLVLLVAWNNVDVLGRVAFLVGRAS